MKRNFVLTLLTFFLLLPTSTLAWDDCPFGLIDDPYPGECNRYIDTDQDGICDRSQSAPEDRVATVSDSTIESTDLPAETTDLDPKIVIPDSHTHKDEDEHEHGHAFELNGQQLKQLTIGELAQYWGDIPVECLIHHLQEATGHTDLTTTTSLQTLHDISDLKPSVIKDIAQAIYEEKNGLENANESQAISSPIQTVKPELPTVPDRPKFMNNYNFLTLSLISAVVFLLSKILVYSKTIKPITEKRSWNVLLLVSFAVSAITGLLLGMQRDDVLINKLPANFLWLHAEFSILMAYIGIYHTFWHWKYFACLIKPKNKRNNKANNECQTK